MKFGQAFKQALRDEGFPADWVESAISYSQLKKCINRLTAELAQLGLDPQTLATLLRHVEDRNERLGKGEGGEELDKPFEYVLTDDSHSANLAKLVSRAGAGSKDAARPGKAEPFHPKLLFYVDETTGALDSANLDRETRKKLQMLAVESGITHLRVFEEPMDPSRSSSVASLDPASSNHDSPTTATATTNSSNATVRKGPQRPGLRIITVPLTSDAEFFSVLSSELSGLEALQAREEAHLQTEITQLGTQIARLTDPDRRANRKLLATWRQIFQCYLEEGIFFGNVERDHSAHNAAKATARYNAFVEKIKEAGLLQKLGRKEGARALKGFMAINMEMLKGLRFGEINQTAMTKILKKFDKRTSLNIRSTLPSKSPSSPSSRTTRPPTALALPLTNPSFSTALAKSLCAHLSTQILSHVPQIDDYACPMCMDIQWRPVRLSCSHIFCIRCLIVMQQRKQGRCPLCREKTVEGACSENLDLERAEFLKKWFPDEVKGKQKYNRMMAGVDEYGEVYNDKCAVM